MIVRSFSAPNVVTVKLTTGTVMYALLSLSFALHDMVLCKLATLRVLMAWRLRSKFARSRIGCVRDSEASRCNYVK